MYVCLANQLILNLFFIIGFIKFGVVPRRPNPILVPMINEALRLVVQWTPGRIQARLQQLTRTLATEVAERGAGAFYMFPGNDSNAAGHIAGIR